MRRVKQLQDENAKLKKLVASGMRTSAVFLRHSSLHWCVAASSEN